MFMTFARELKLLELFSQDALYMFTAVDRYFFLPGVIQVQSQ